jgi:capsular polysaccharide biosynthesis protein
MVIEMKKRKKLILLVAAAVLALAGIFMSSMSSPRWNA